MMLANKKILSAVLSLSMLGMMAANNPFKAAAATYKAAESTDTAIGVSYSTQVQTYGWKTAVSDGALSGTTGESKRLEAIKVNLTGSDLPNGALISYKTYVQTFGWQSAVSNGALSGTVGQSKRLEAVKITLNGLPGYDVEYRSQVQSYGWQDWQLTKNGTDIDKASLSGTVGQSKRLEAIEIRVAKTSEETAAETSAQNAVAAAEISKLQADISAAKALTEKIDVLSVKTALSKRLDAIAGSESGTGSSTALMVSSITATSTKTIAIKFNHAPDDTSLIKATVKLGTSYVDFTLSWNYDNTVLTLTSPTTPVFTTYTVCVTNGSTDLDSENVNLSYQRIDKIDIVTDFGSVEPYKSAYAMYKLYDQYGNDVTYDKIYNNLSFTCPHGTLSYSNGLLELTAGTGIDALPSYNSTYVTAEDTTSGALTVKNVKITSKDLFVTDATLGTELTNAEGKLFTAGDTTDVFYLPFTAHIVGGRLTSSYNLIKSGLIFANDDTLELPTSNSYVTARLVEDPNDSSKAAIRVEYVNNGSYPPASGTFVTIAAMTWAGTCSTTTVMLN